MKEKIFRIFLLCLLLVSPVSYAIERCTKPDASFRGFLNQFTSDITFQTGRIILPLVYRNGMYSLMDPEIQLWDLQRIRKLKDPIILSRKQREERHIEESMLIVTQSYAEVFHSKPEADSYLLLYKFRNLDGCWYLEELHDKSL